MLNWSVETIAFRAWVSVKAIRKLEAGRRTLRRVTMHALSFTLEAEGLVFLPGLSPCAVITAVAEPRPRGNVTIYICLSSCVPFLARRNRQKTADSVEKVGRGFHGRKVRV